jgi:hypothetical protein
MTLLDKKHYDNNNCINSAYDLVEEFLNFAQAFSKTAKNRLISRFFAFEIRTPPQLILKMVYQSHMFLNQISYRRYNKKIP